MTTPFKLIIRFEDLGQPRFLTKTDHIIHSLTSGPALELLPEPWPASCPSRVQLVSAHDAYAKAQMAADDGGHSARSARNEARDILTRLLKNAACYFEMTAKMANNIMILVATGYDLRRPGQATPDWLDAPHISARRGPLSGVLIVRGQRLRGARLYETQYCSGDPGVAANWQHGVTTTGCLHIELKGLTPGQIYFVRVCGIGRRGPGAWSNTVNLMAT